MKEEQHECKHPSAQMSIEVRVNPTKKDHICDECHKKTAARVGGELRRPTLVSLELTVVEQVKYKHPTSISLYNSCQRACAAFCSAPRADARGNTRQPGGRSEIKICSVHLNGLPVKPDKRK